MLLGQTLFLEHSCEQGRVGALALVEFLVTNVGRHVSRNTSELDFGRRRRRQRRWAGSRCVSGPESEEASRGQVVSAWQGRGKRGYRGPKRGVALARRKSRKQARVAGSQVEESGGRCRRGGRPPFPVSPRALLPVQFSWFSFTLSYLCPSVP